MCRGSKARLFGFHLCYGLKATHIEDDRSSHVDMGPSRWTCYCWNMSHNFQTFPNPDFPTRSCILSQLGHTKLTLPAISINFARLTLVVAMHVAHICQECHWAKALHVSC